MSGCTRCARICHRPSSSSIWLAARAVVSGSLTADLLHLEPGTTQADLLLEVAAADLGRLQPLGVPGMARGEAQLHGRLQLQAGKAQLDLEASGKRLGLAPVQA